jgi:hypothetical protein
MIAFFGYTTKSFLKETLAQVTTGRPNYYPKHVRVMVFKRHFIRDLWRFEQGT